MQQNFLFFFKASLFLYTTLNRGKVLCEGTALQSRHWQGDCTLHGWDEPNRPLFLSNWLAGLQAAPPNLLQYSQTRLCP